MPHKDTSIAIQQAIISVLQIPHRHTSLAINNLYIDPKLWGRFNLVISTQGFSALNATQGH